MYKNATIYTLTSGVLSTLMGTDWSQVFTDFPQKSPGPLEYQSIGFVDVLPDLPYINQLGALFFAVSVERRVLPAAAVDRELKIRLRKLEEGTGVKATGKARKQLKDDIVTEMLPRAFIKPQRVEFFIDTNAGLLIVDASRGQADEVVSFLRHCLGSLPVLPASSEQSISLKMNQWLMTLRLPEGLGFGDRAHFESSVDRAVTTFKGRLPGENEMRELEDFMQVPVKLELETDFISFILDDNYSLKGIKARDIFIEKRNENVGDEASMNDVEIGSRLLMRESISQALTLIGSELPISR